MTRELYQIIVMRLCCAVAIIFIALTAIGAINNYTPVPFWDMWDGNVLFYTRILDGDVSAWWAQHVNHRTVFSNVLFYIDHKVFGGQNYFLIISHFVLLGLLVFWFRQMFLLDGQQKKLNHIQLAILSIIVVLLFSWIQMKNITWAFQSQMFAAHLIPAFSFYFLFKSHLNKNKPASHLTYLAATLVFGVVSAFTMMNGVLVLPLLVLFALCLRLRLVVTGVILLACIVTLKLYFTGYASPEGQGDMVQTFLSRPFDTLKFSFMLLGSPAYYMTGTGSEIAALIVGIVVAGLFTCFSLKLFVSRDLNPQFSVLIFVLFYEAATVFGIASGRLIHGFDQAFVSRYMTSSLFIWAVLIFSIAITFKSSFEKKPKFLFAYLLIPALLLPYQMKALDKNINPRFQMLGAALAVELNVQDAQQINNYIWPWMDVLYIIAERAQV